MTSSVPVVILGCRLTRPVGGGVDGALGRRIRAGRLEFERAGGWLLVTGGRTWRGVVEADAMRDELERAGVPRRCIVQERCSLTTRGNARFSAALLRRVGATRIRLVTCDWHMHRAQELFRRAGLEVEPVPAPSPHPSLLVRLYRRAHEQLSSRFPRGSLA